MNKVNKLVKKRMIEIENDIKNIEKFLGSAPQGTLNYKIIKDRVYYYQQFTSSTRDIKDNSAVNQSDNTNKNDNARYNITRNINQKYIKKKELKKAKALAQKSYYLAIKPILEEQYKQLLNFLENDTIEKIQNVYSSLSDIRKELIVPIDISIKERIRLWNEEKYKENDYFSENKKYETDGGEYVRSKSEMIIANELYKYRNDILYKYERPLDILVNGIVHTIYPDFTILNIHTGKITYLEHAGCMDNPNYANDFIKKINNYIMNDIVPGIDLITTYESRDCPLDIKVVKKIIEDIV